MIRFKLKKKAKFIFIKISKGKVVTYILVWNGIETYELAASSLKIYRYKICSKEYNHYLNTKKGISSPYFIRYTCGRGGIPLIWVCEDFLGIYRPVDLEGKVLGSRYGIRM